MATRTTDALFQLIKSLTKAEKRNFRNYMTRNMSRTSPATADELKVVLLFDALDKMEQYDDEGLLKKNPSLKRQQLSNLKAHLYKQILASLRLLKDAENIDLQLHEQMDFARILYNKGLYLQSLKVLDKLKQQAREYHQFTFLQQAVFFEKKIEALYITRSMKDRAIQLANESTSVHEHLQSVGQLSNLSLLLYSWYIQHGHARNADDVAHVDAFFQAHCPQGALQQQGFYNRLYVYQSYCWLNFIKQNYAQYYRYAKYWVELFAEYPAMKEVETGWYIKGLHNLLGACFDTQHIEAMKTVLSALEEFATTPMIKSNENYRILCFVYINMARLNICMSEGEFEYGVQLVPTIEYDLQEYELYMDHHRVLVFYYKFASLYFGSGNNAKAIEYLNEIIQTKTDLRTDLQCYARLLHLIAHFELGHLDVVEHLLKSVYRFMASMETIGAVEQELFAFLRASFRVQKSALQNEFKQLIERLRAIEHNQFSTRSFVYLDIISWLESKVQNVPVHTIIRAKYHANTKKKR
jgi:hypothetical protein